MQHHESCRRGEENDSQRAVIAEQQEENSAVGDLEREERDLEGEQKQIEVSCSRVQASQRPSLQTAALPGHSSCS